MQNKALKRNLINEGVYKTYSNERYILNKQKKLNVTTKEYITWYRKKEFTYIDEKGNETTIYVNKDQKIQEEHNRKVINRLRKKEIKDLKEELRIEIEKQKAVFYAQHPELAEGEKY